MDGQHVRIVNAMNAWPKEDINAQHAHVVICRGNRRERANETETPVEKQPDGLFTQNGVRANFLDRLAIARVEEEIEQRQTALRVALVRVRTDRAVEREALQVVRKKERRTMGRGPHHLAAQTQNDETYLFSTCV